MPTNNQVSDTLTSEALVQNYLLDPYDIDALQPRC